MRIFTEALYLQQATQDAELEEPDVFMRQRDAAIFASLDSADEEARQRCGASASTEQLTASDDDLYLSDDDYEPAADASQEARYF